MRTTRWVGALIVMLAVPAHRATAQTDERREVLAVVQRMLDAIRTKDTAVVRSTFEPGARLVGTRQRRDGTTVLQVLTVDRWVAFIAGDTRGPWDERTYDPEVRIEGTLAQVWAAYDFRLGGTFSHCGIDAVQLLKIGGEWKIVSLADTFQPTGCPARPGP